MKIVCSFEQETIFFSCGADNSASHALLSQEDEMEESTITSVNIKVVVELLNIFVISFYI